MKFKTEAYVASGRRKFLKLFEDGEWVQSVGPAAFSRKPELLGDLLSQAYRQGVRDERKLATLC